MRGNLLKSCLFGLSLFIGLSSYSQVLQPEYGAAFLQDEVATVRVELTEENLDYILDSDNWAQEEVPATFIYESSLGIDTVFDIGFRLRGNTSLGSGKKSFKVSFTEYNNGRRWNGLKKLNLNGEHNDVSLMRSRLCWELLRESGMAASRTSYVNLYVNDEFRGVYLNVEHIDNEFISKRYSEENGNLYKCTWPADLNYNGNNASNYQGGEYELKTNEWWDETHEDIASFVTDLNQLSDEELECRLPQTFNVREYIKNLAMEVLIGHWDGYSVNKNNYYLYNNLEQQRIEFLHYDLDNTFGIDWFNEDWSTRNIYNWSSDWEDRPLYDAIMDNPHWRNIYSYEMNRLIENHFTVENIQNKINTWKTLISPHVENDEYYTNSYGFNHSDFLEADTESWGNHVTQGILEYTEDRINSANEQLESFSTPQGIFFSEEFYPVWGENTIGIYFLTDPNATPEADLHFQLDGGPEQIIEFEDYSDGYFYAEVTFDESNSILSYQIHIDEGELSTTYPCNLKTIPLGESNQSLVINEVMADNESTLTDEEGNFEDWLELYNTGSASINLGTFYLTDNLEFPNKWKLPETNIASAQHELIWCDDDPEQSNFHTNFKIENNGEILYIFEPFADGFRVVDSILLPELGNDQSYGRLEDGSSEWVIFLESTPNAQNGIVYIEESSLLDLQAYPNPTEGSLNLSEEKSYTLLNSLGAFITTGKSSQIDLSQLPSGTYLLKIDSSVIRIVRI